MGLFVSALFDGYSWVHVCYVADGVGCGPGQYLACFVPDWAGQYGPLGWACS